MAAFGSRRVVDRATFVQHWKEHLRDPTVRLRTILVGGRVAGYVGRFPLFGRPAVAYFLGRSFWGQGVATRALRAFLRTDRTRPLFARVAYDNAGSRRVLEKCGFVRVGRARSHAAARGRRLTEHIYRLDATRPPSAPARSFRKRPPPRPRRSGSPGA
jgi:[ribosomal protein S5]-alanine N-acetyltransferase